VPSFVELGYTDLVVKEWFAFFAPGKTSKHTVASLSTALQQAIARPEVSATFAQAGMAAASSSPATLVARIALEQRYWKPVLQALAIKGE
jgi:tripartite-type tricarboxylate transporter receptor subunit TctC